MQSGDDYSMTVCVCVCVTVAVYTLHIQYGLLALSKYVCKINLRPYL